MKIVHVVFSLVLLLTGVETVSAQQITVYFSYTGTADGFRLYQNSVQVCEINDGTAREIMCDVTINADDEYTMSAITAGVAGTASVMHRAGRVNNIYKRMRGGAFSGGSM